MGGALLSRLARWEEALPQCVWPHEGGMQGKAGEADPANESGDRRPAEWNGCGVSGRFQPQEKAAGGVPAPEPRREQ